MAVRLDFMNILLTTASLFLFKKDWPTARLNKLAYAISTCSHVVQAYLTVGQHVDIRTDLIGLHKQANALWLGRRHNTSNIMWPLRWPIGRFNLQLAYASQVQATQWPYIRQLAQPMQWALRPNGRPQATTKWPLYVVCVAIGQHTTHCWPVV